MQPFNRCTAPLKERACSAPAPPDGRPKRPAKTARLRLGARVHATHARWPHPSGVGHLANAPARQRQDHLCGFQLRRHHGGNGGGDGHCSGHPAGMFASGKRRTAVQRCATSFTTTARAARTRHSGRRPPPTVADGTPRALCACAMVTGGRSGDGQPSSRHRWLCPRTRCRSRRSSAPSRRSSWLVARHAAPGQSCAPPALRQPRRPAASLLRYVEVTNAQHFDFSFIGSVPPCSAGYDIALCCAAASCT